MSLLEPGVLGVGLCREHEQIDGERSPKQAGVLPETQVPAWSGARKEAGHQVGFPVRVLLGSPTRANL